MAAGSYTGVGVANDISARTEMIRTRMDEIVKKELVTAGMNANAEIVAAFGSAKTASLPTLETTGLGNYDKVKGYPIGSATVTWKDYTLAYDRGISVDIDRVDNLQTGGIASAANSAAYIARNVIVPEVDAVRMAQLYTKVKAYDTETAATTTHVVDSTAPTAANIISEIGKGLDVIFEEMPGDTGATVYINNAYKQVLRASTEVTKTRNVQSGSRSIDLVTNEIDGNKIVYVPSARMKSALTMYDGVTNGQTTGGYVSATGAEDIAFAIVAPGCAQGVTIVANSKTITADVNQTKDADRYMYRLYHDLIVEKNSGYKGCYVYGVKATE